MELRDEKFLCIVTKNHVPDEESIAEVYKQVLPFNVIRARLDANLKSLLKFRLREYSGWYQLSEEETVMSIRSSIHNFFLESKKAEEKTIKK